MRDNPDLQSHVSNPRRSKETGNKSRHVARLSNIPILGRSVFISRVQQVAAHLPTQTRYSRLTAFLQFWNWLRLYLKDLVHKRHPYQTYTGAETGIFPVATPDNGPLRIALTADWGTGTQEAEAVAANIRSGRPHITVHLGDVYFTGEGNEINENCFGQSSNSHKGVTWPLGSLGSFALLGNHEMYSGGQGYFTAFLNKLGLFRPDKTIQTPQSASFFCLEADHWLILGLDTGYHSGGVPPLTTIPLINTIPVFNVDARFDEQMLTWLRKTMTALQRDERRKPVVVLTHHQPVSSFEHAFLKPAQQLAELEFLNGHEFIWIYGHEHRLTIYEKQTIAKSLVAYPRCIGHGGMPVEVTSLSRVHPEILFFDPREHPIDKDHPNTKVGYNGHLNLIVKDAYLIIEYRDIITNNLLLKETFGPGDSGKLSYTSTLPPESPLISGRAASR